MSRASSDPQSASSRSASSNETKSEQKELFVTTDWSAIPASELRPLCNNVWEWVSAIVKRKVSSTAADPDFVVESRRVVPARHVPKRMHKYFAKVTREMKALEFTDAFAATRAALGPYSTAMVGMSRPAGDIHFLASQEVTEREGKIRDETWFAFLTWLKGKKLLVTTSALRHPVPRAGVDRVVTRSDSAGEVLKTHQQRLKGQTVDPVPPEEYFGRYQAEVAKQTDDWLRRKVIRLATPAEISRIRSAR